MNREKSLYPELIFVLVLLLILPFFLPACGGESTSRLDRAQSAAVWEPPATVTIYFAGTGMTGGQWQENSSSWDREVVASLHHWQQTSETQLKTFVDGIGTGCSYAWDWFDILDLINQGIPGWEACRGWETGMTEAQAFLEDTAIGRFSGNFILNLVGFSRGGITTMRFANRVAEISTISSRIDKINILAFDPVAGDTSLSPDEFVLGGKVAQYVGIYATDERTAMFSPALPDFESPDTEVWMFRVPGAHETMVGNPETDGHSTNINLGCGIFLLEECTDPELLNVSWVTTFVATDLLGSSQWGALTFDMASLAEWHAGLDDTGAADLFVDKVDTLWDHNYFNQRKFAASALIGFESCRWEPDLNILYYKYYAVLDWLILQGFNDERCTDWFFQDSQAQPSTVVWRRQALESGPRMWVDSLSDGEQALAMLDHLGGSPPVADVGGPYAGSEGDPLVFDASDSVDPDGDVLLFRWDFNNDDVWDTTWSENPLASWTFGDDFEGLVRVEISDSDSTGVASAPVTVLNVAPAAQVISISGPNPFFILPRVHTLKFEGSYSDPGWLDEHTSSWHAGDGSTLTGNMEGEMEPPNATGTTTAEYIYELPGIYPVVLELADDDGGTVTTADTVHVATAQEALTAINDYIHMLPSTSFKNRAVQRRQALANKFKVVAKMISEDRSDPAVSKLLRDIFAKASGPVDGKDQDDWVTEPVACEDICLMINDLVAYLNTF
jgi:hypothetical protein